jgi:2-oxoglutarate dehydrogenase E1 component
LKGLADPPDLAQRPVFPRSEAVDPNVFETANAGFAQALYEDFLRDPQAVPPEWRQLFESGRVGEQPTAAAGNGATPVAGAPAPAGPPASATPPASPASRTSPTSLIKGPAARLVANMNESLTVPTATSFRELPVQELEQQRASLNAALKAGGRSEKVSFTHLIGWALIQATKKHPVMGHTLAMVEGAPHRVEPTGISLGLAVDVERKDGSRGLVVPVLKGAEGRWPRFWAKASCGITKASRWAASSPSGKIPLKRN